MSVEKEKLDYIICGGGASGLLLLQALTQDSFFSNKKILLIEREFKKSNDRTWSFWEEPNGDFDDLLYKKWNEANFVGPKNKQVFSLAPYQYKMLRSSSFYKKYFPKKTESKHKQILQASISKIKSENGGCMVITDKGTFIASKVFSSLLDTKGLTSQTKYPVLKQHFIGWFIKAPEKSFDPDKILFMDFNIPQQEQTRFMYILPKDDQHALIEYTLFSKKLLERHEYEKEIKKYLTKIGIKEYKIQMKEQGNIPMSCYPFNKSNTSNLLHIGTAGGWTKASTGFTFINTVRQVDRLIHFLKTEKPLTAFHQKNRFWFYDLLFLDVLDKHNEKGSELFIRMFAKNPPLRVLRFLDEKTSFGEELLVMYSFSFKQIGWFLSAFFKRVF